MAGLRIEITGKDRTLDAIRRMIQPMRPNSTTGRLDRKERAVGRWHHPHRDEQRSAASGPHSRIGLHRPPGQRIASSAASLAMARGEFAH